MSYDRDSFLAGLAVGRTLWRPHRDYGEQPFPLGYDLIGESTGIVGRTQRQNYNMTAVKGVGDTYDGRYYYLASALVPSGYEITGEYTYLNGSVTGMIDTPIPARYNKLYIDIDSHGESANLSTLYLCDGYGLTGPQAGNFSGNILKEIAICAYDKTAEEINSQGGVTINTNDPDELDRQTVIIDISAITVDCWLGLFRSQTNATHIHSIYARMG